VKQRKEIITKTTLTLSVDDLEEILSHWLKLGPDEFVRFDFNLLKDWGSDAVKIYKESRTVTDDS
jgi:hypothetical protein